MNTLHQILRVYILVILSSNTRPLSSSDRTSERFLRFTPFAAAAKCPIQRALFPFRRARTMIPTFRLATQLLGFVLVLIHAQISAFPTLLFPFDSLLDFLLLPNIVDLPFNVPTSTYLRRTARGAFLPLGRALGPIGEQLPPRAVLDPLVVTVETDMVRVLQAFDTDPATLVEIEHRLGIHLHPPIGLQQRPLIPAFPIRPIPPDHAPGLLLIHHRRPPRLIDILLRKARQLRHIPSHERALLVPFFGERERGIAAVELGVEGDAGEPLPVPRVARHLVVQQPLGEDLGPALPVDVAAAARQEAGHGVTAQVVHPAFVPQLAHQGVDPGEARAAVLPAPEPGFVQGGADGVGGGARGGGGGRRGGGGRGEVPGHEAAVGVADRLGKGVAECGLGAEVHVAEEELAEEVGRDRAGLFALFAVGFHRVGRAPVEESHGEGAEVVVGRKDGRCGWGECGWGCGRFGEGCGVALVGDYAVECREGEGFAAAVEGCCGFEAEFGIGGHGKGCIGAGELVVGGLGARALESVDVWFLRGPILRYVECGVAWVGQRFGGWNWARYVS